ncbi:MAG: ABC transporter ATP-binding protein [Bacillota bacterium]|nr:ABC transporter ATP-binding protein [Bacillota bacterium]
MDEALKVEGLYKTYGRGAKAVQALKGVSFAARRGEILGLLGPNGAGKTTTMKSILGLIEADAGKIEVFGKDLWRRPREAARHIAAVLEGNRNIYWRLTPLENMAFMAGLQGIDAKGRRKQHEAILEILDLGDKKDTVVNHLSRGMKQKVAIACAFARETEILLLDEPTLGLDLSMSYTLRRQLLTLAQEEKRTILLSSHDMDVVQDLCRRVVIIDQGKVMADDEVAHLQSLFASDTYEVLVAGSLTSDFLALLSSRFTLAEPEEEDGLTRLRVTFQDHGDLYRLMDLLREGQMIVRSLTRVEVDLGSIFLQVTGAKTEEVTA